MQINISTNKVPLTDKIREMIEGKLGRDLDKFLETYNEDMKIAQVHIEKPSRWGYTVSFNMVLPGKDKLYAVTRRSTLMRAVTDVRNKLRVQIKKHREKLTEEYKIKDKNGEQKELLYKTENKNE